MANGLKIEAYLHEAGVKGKIGYHIIFGSFHAQTNTKNQKSDFCPVRRHVLFSVIIYAAVG